MIQGKVEVTKVDYDEAVGYLMNLGRFGSRPGLHRITRLMGVLGNSQDSLSVIHVAGTNGKGSTCAFLERALRHLGFRVGLFSSPHLQSIRERIAINGKWISREAFARVISQVQKAAAAAVAEGQEHPTFFEMLTAAMYYHFHQENVDFVVQEVGLGGRFDATNVVAHPLVTLITDVSLDHTQVLGNNIGDIAWEKAGIVKPQVPTVTCVSQPEALQRIEAVCRERSSPLTIVHKTGLAASPKVGFDVLRHDEAGGDFSFWGKRWDCKAGHTKMLGEHQIRNASLALAALEEIPEIKDGEGVCQGIAETCWPGRLEKVQMSPRVLLDGAHNRQAAQMLAETLRSLYPTRRIHGAMGFLPGKDWQGMLDEMAPVLDGKIIALPFPSSLDTKEIAVEAKDRLYRALTIDVGASIADCLRGFIASIDKEDVLIIWGSLYLVGDVRKVLFRGMVSD